MSVHLTPKSNIHTNHHLNIQNANLLEADRPSWWKTLALLILAIPSGQASTPYTLHSATTAPIYHLNNAWLSNGEKIAIWATGNNDQRDLGGSIRDENGNPINEPLAVVQREYQINRLQSCAMGNGNLAVAWQQYYIGEQNYVRMEILNSNGAKTTNMTDIFHQDYFVKDGISVDCRQGGYSVVGLHAVESGDGWNAYFRSWNNNQIPRFDGKLIKSESRHILSIFNQVSLKNGNQLVLLKQALSNAQNRDHQLIAYEMDPMTGAKVGGEKNLTIASCNTFTNYVAASGENGNFAVVFECITGVWAKIYKDNGTPLSQDIHIDSGGSQPAITKASAGLVITYQTVSDIRDTLLDGSGTTILAPFKIATRTDTAYAKPDVSARGNNLFHAYQDNKNVYGIDVDLTPLLTSTATPIAIPTTKQGVQPTTNAPPVTPKVQTPTNQITLTTADLSTPQAASSNAFKSSSLQSATQLTSPTNSSPISSPLTEMSSDSQPTASSPLTENRSITQIQVAQDQTPSSNETPVGLIAGIVTFVVSACGGAIGFLLYRQNKKKGDVSLENGAANAKPNNQYDNLPANIQQPVNSYSAVPAPLEANLNGCVNKADQNKNQYDSVARVGDRANNYDQLSPAKKNNLYDAVDSKLEV